MSGLTAAKAARDELISRLHFQREPHQNVIGVGIAREDGGYVVAVTVLTDASELPDEINGVPVRWRRGSRPVAFARTSVPPSSRAVTEGGK